MPEFTQRTTLTMPTSLSGHNVARDAKPSSDMDLMRAPAVKEASLENASQVGVAEVSSAKGIKKEMEIKGEGIAIKVESQLASIKQGHVTREPPHFSHVDLHRGFRFLENGDIQTVEETLAIKQEPDNKSHVGTLVGFNSNACNSSAADMNKRQRTDAGHFNITGNASVVQQLRLFAASPALRPAHLDNAAPGEQTLPEAKKLHYPHTSQKKWIWKIPQRIVMDRRYSLKQLRPDLAEEIKGCGEKECFLHPYTGFKFDIKHDDAALFSMTKQVCSYVKKRPWQKSDSEIRVTAKFCCGMCTERDVPPKKRFV